MYPDGRSFGGVRLKRGLSNGEVHTTSTFSNNDHVRGGGIYPFFFFLHEQLLAKLL